MRGFREDREVLGAMGSIGGDGDVLGCKEELLERNEGVSGRSEELLAAQGVFWGYRAIWR